MSAGARLPGSHSAAAAARAVRPGAGALALAWAQARPRALGPRRPPGCARRLRPAPPRLRRRENLSPRSRDPSAPLRRQKPPPAGSRASSLARSLRRALPELPGSQRCRGRGVAGNRGDAGSWRATAGRTSAEGSSPGAGPREMLGPSRPRPSPLPGPGVLKSFLKATPHPGDRMVPLDAPLATLLHGGIGLKGAAKASKSNGFHKRCREEGTLDPSRGWARGEARGPW